MRIDFSQLTHIEIDGEYDSLSSALRALADALEAAPGDATPDMEPGAEFDDLSPYADQLPVVIVVDDRLHIVYLDGDGV